MKKLAAVLMIWALTAGFAAEPAKFEAAAKPDYLLSPGDKLSISIEQDPSPGRPIDVLVLASGELEVPVSRCCESVISVQAKGRALKDVENDLKAKLEGDFYH